MRALNQLVLSGKVLYLGISDTPAWIVSKANECKLPANFKVGFVEILTKHIDARNHGMATFVVYQGWWSASVRDFERDIIPMCEAEGMGIAPWGTLGRGNYKTEAQQEATKGEGRNFGDASEEDLKVAKVLEGVAKRKKAEMTSIVSRHPSHLFQSEVLLITSRLWHMLCTKLQMFFRSWEAAKLAISRATSRP